MLVGGEKLDGERLIWWNFVASSREGSRLKAKWRAQAFGSVRRHRFIPLPER
jgi:redox-sensitive bicupin YhaK (pirin superfamily)